MAEAWEDMTDVQRASALELMGGKRQANVLSALIQNFDTVEKVIETSANSAGSALKENARWMDSIQGKINTFNNSLQAMWSNFLDSDTVKNIVAFGIELIKIIDDVGLLKIALMGVGMYLTRGMDWTAAFSKPIEKTVTNAQSTLADLKADMDAAVAEDATKKTKQSAKKAEEATQRYNNYKLQVEEIEAEDLLNKKAQERIDLQKQLNVAQDKYEAGLEKLGGQEQDGSMAIEAWDEMDALQKKIDENGMSIEDANKRMQNFNNTVDQTGKKGSISFDKLKGGLKAFGKQLAGILVQMAAMYAITTAVELISKGFELIGRGLDPLRETAEEAQEEFEQLSSELSNAKSELRSLESELDKTNDRMDELLSMGTLSFVEQEELNNLREQSSELERQIELAKTLEETLTRVTSIAAINASQKTFSQTSFYSEESKEERAAEAKESGKSWGQGIGLFLGGLLYAALVAGGVFTGGATTALAFAGGGALLGGSVGGAYGESSENAKYDSEKSVTEVLNNMKAERVKLEKTRDEAYAAYVKDPENEDITKQWEEAQSALGTYDSTLAQHIGQMQQYINSIDPDTLTNPADKAYYDQMKQWVDTYSVMMGGPDAKASVIESIFGENAEGGFKKAQIKIDRLKENLKEARESGDANAIADALSALQNLDLTKFLSDEEIARLRDMDIYLYEAEDALTEVAEAEAEVADSGLEDVAKDINKIEEGLSSLKSAFEEVAEKGVLTAQTISSLKEALKIDSAKDVEGVTTAWNEYLKVMMSGVATTEQMTAATEKLATQLLNSALENNELKPETKREYVAQLKVLGVENAEEYVDDLLQKNMVKDVEKEISDSFDNDATYLAFIDEYGTLGVELWEKMTEGQKLYYAWENNLLDLTQEQIDAIAEKYGVESDQITNIIDQLKEKKKLENEKDLIQTKKDNYDAWYNGDGTNAGYGGLKQDIEGLKKELDGFNPDDWTYSYVEDANGNGMYRSSDGKYMTETEYEALEEKYEKLQELQEKFKKLQEEGLSKGYFQQNEDGSYVFDAGGNYVLKEGIEKDFEEAYKAAENGIKAIDDVIDTKLTADIQLKLELQNKSDLVDDIQNVFDTLMDAQKEYGENGYITVDTLQNLLKLEPKYLDLLVDEQGNLNLTKDAIYNVARARIVDMGIQSQQNVLAKAYALAEEGSSSALRDHITVMQEANETGVDFVEIEMKKIQAILAERVAAKELSQAEADAFIAGTRNQIQAIQVTTQIALDNLANSLSSSGNTATSEAEDAVKKQLEAFQAAMDYWENRISANQARYEQVQNEIDLLDKKGQKANADYYNEQMVLENERLGLLKQQKAEAEKFLGTFTEGSDEWWEVASQLNDIESEIDSVTASIIDLQDAIGEIETYKFDEFGTRLDNLTSKLETIRNLIAPDSEEDWFDSEGQWTEDGIAVLGTYVQELEHYRQGLAQTEDAIADFNKIGGGAEWADLTEEQREGYAQKYGVHSEQEYYDATEKLISQQYDFAESISDTEQSIVDMYESSIDAVEEYIDTLIDSYSDYISSVKEALDAEKDLYDFKRKIEDQSKSIAETERKIIALSGSTNAADVAERRKLEQTLFEQKRDLDDSYRDHSLSSQNDALDAEQEAYETAMTKMVENMRTSLEEATADMDTFLNNVTIAASMNADIILQKYKDTNVELDPALTNPWENAKTAVGNYGTDATNLMDVWKKDGYFAEFKTTAGINLSSPWNAGTNAANAFKTSVSNVMSGVVSNISQNVQAASGQLSALYQQIIDTEKRAASANVSTGGGYTGGGYIDQTPQSNPSVKALQEILRDVYGKTGIRTDGVWDTGTANALNEVQLKIRATPSGKYDYGTEQTMRANIETRRNLSRKEGLKSDADWYTEQLKKLPTAFHAKGTLGTKRDEWAITDESWIGEEITLAAGKNGQLQYLKKGSAVMPADISANLVEWGKIDPNMLSIGATPNINMINNAVNKPEINLSFEALVKAERIDEGTLPEVKKFVQQEINTLVKQMNYAIKGKGGR